MFGVQMQGFNWESSKRDWYMEMAPKAAELAASGITAVWLPPPTESVSPEGKHTFLAHRGYTASRLTHSAASGITAGCLAAASHGVVSLESAS